MESVLLHCAFSEHLIIDQSLAFVLKRKYRVKKKIFDINDYSTSECLSFFRFDHDDIKQLRKLFRIPVKFTTKGGRVCDGKEALCITLRRLAYPNRYVDLTNMFDREDADFSYIFNSMIDYLYDNFNFKLTSFNQPWLDIPQLQQYSEAISTKGCPLPNCWGFIDGTIRAMCRPVRHQKEVYNGHKRVHALKYQSIVTPNGLIANLYGPVSGRRHDAFLLSESGVMPQLSQLLDMNNEPFCIYGDPAYPIRPYLLKPYRGLQLTAAQQEFNKRMSSVRECVEWQFGKVASLFAFVDYKKNQKLLLQPLAKYYAVSVLLTNCHTCIYGSETGKFFNVLPPTLNEYLSMF